MVWRRPKVFPGFRPFRSKLEYTWRYFNQALVHSQRFARSFAYRYFAWFCALPKRPTGNHVCSSTVDYSSICGFFNSRRVQCFLQKGFGRWWTGRICCFRFGHTQGLWLWSPKGDGRCGQSGCGDWFCRGYEDLVWSNSFRQSFCFHDHEWRSITCSCWLCRCCRRAGREPSATEWNDSERYSQRVHGAKYLYLPAWTQYANCGWHHCLHRATHAEIQFHQHQWLSHAGGWCKSVIRARPDFGRWARICSYSFSQRLGCWFVCAALIVFLGDRHEFLPWDCQNAGRKVVVVPNHARLWSKKPQKLDVAYPLSNLWLELNWARPLQQHCENHHWSHGRSFWRYPKFAYQQFWRSHCFAYRVLFSYSSKYPIDHSRGDPY